MAREDLLSVAARLQQGFGLPLADRIQPSDDLAIRARKWFVEAWHHPLWRAYRQAAEEDLGYYLGGDRQWVVDGSREDVQALKDSGRAVVSINHIKPVVKVLTGYERQNRADPHAQPEGNEDVEDAQIWSWLVKFYADQVELQEHFSEQFEDGLIQGMKAIALEIDWSQDPVKGELVATLLTPGRDCIWDGTWSKYDLSDCRYFLRYKWVYVDDFTAEYPEQADAIQAAVAELHLAWSASESPTTDGGATDAYGSVRSHPIENLGIEQLFYDPNERKILVLEAWYRKRDDEYFVLDKLSGTAIPAKTAQAMREAVASDPENLEALHKRPQRIHMGVILPATYQVIEEAPTPYENDKNQYPFVVYVAERKGDHVLGIVRDLKDPQRVENKRIGQMLDILGKFANLRLTYQERSLVDPRVLHDPHSDAPIAYKDGMNPPSYLVPPIGDLVRVLSGVAMEMRGHIRESSGVNTDMQGMRETQMSGIAIARQQAQGQVINTPYFDNMRRTRHLAYQRLARRIQQVMTTEEYVRLTNDWGETVTVVVNPIGTKDMTKDEFTRYREELKQAGKPHVLRDVSSLKYDIKFSEAPTTPTARAMQLLGLLEVIQKVPTIWPAMIDKIVELLDVSGRADILRRVKQIVDQQFPEPGQAPAPGAPAPPGEAPPPGTPPPGPPAPGAAGSHLPPKAVAATVAAHAGGPAGPFGAGMGP